MYKIIITVLMLYLGLALNTTCILCVKAKIECGYKQCPQTREGALNVHLIPHSHMDAGWVKTFDEYYYGTRTTISTANVQLIYHSVLSELLHDRRRKFTFSETAYFWRWWKEQRPATRATFRTLVQEGRVEFAGGGWVQNDEATLDYLEIIDQFTWGLRKLNDTLGLCGKPRAAWQIDTYGHTREQASLLAQMGFDGLFLGRVDHKQREKMVEEDRMEFMWRGSDVLGKMSDIMSHTLYNLYNAPEGFCFDFLCSDEPLVDDPDNQAYNAEKRVTAFIAQIERQAKYYDHDNIAVTMGGDFTYQSAANWFINMDKLINHVNTHPANISDVNIFYSTPSCYLKAIYLYGRRDKAIYTERGDHLPYGSDANTYWTGYYTSRPSLKYLVRKTHAFLQVVKQLTVIAGMGDSFELHLLRHAANLVLHHDGITGTSQQHVTSDFISTMSEAVESCTNKLSHIMSYLKPTWGGSRRSKNFQQFTVCHELNMTQCRFTESQESMLVMVYNPSSVKTYHHVRIPAIALHYNIRDYNDEEVEYQLVPLPAAVINLPGRTSTAIQELCFEAENVPPLGFSAYFISTNRDVLEENEYAKKVAQSNKSPEPADQELAPIISNEYLKVTVNKNTGLLESIQHIDGVKIELSQNFYFYSQTQQSMQSGAYSFRPESNRPVQVTEKVSYNTIRGAIVKEIRQRFADWITQVVRLYRGEEFVELEWIIGPVPIGADLGKEVVTILKTNVSNNGVFHTDSNGRQMMKRTCWNETATQQQKKPVAACYFPVSARICVHSVNSSAGVCVLTDRAQGGTSYGEGELELMVHRRLLTDDGFGLEEALNEEAFGLGLVARGRHRIYFGDIQQDVDDLTFPERMSQASRRWGMEPWLLFTPGDQISRRKWQNVRNRRFSALKPQGLPRHIHILTLEPWKGGSVLLRLENTLEKTVRGHMKTEAPLGTEDFATSASHITVQLRKVFHQLQVKRVRETTLAGNQWLDDARQMDWSTRYVYSGADDDILPEDQTGYKEDPKITKEDSKEPVQYSEEDQGYSRRRRVSPKFRRRRPNKGNSKIKAFYEETYRKKRYANVLENVINSTFNDNNVTKEVNTEAITEVEDQTETTEINNPISTTKYTEKFFEQLKDTKSVIKPYKTTKSSIYANGRVFSKANKFSDFDRDSEEITSVEEDFSTSVKKDSRDKSESKMKTDRQDYCYTTTASEKDFLLCGRKKRRKKPTVPLTSTEPDDGITKSIYEMYYKTKPRPVAFKPLRRTLGGAEGTEYIRHSRKREKKIRNSDNRSGEDVRGNVRGKRREEEFSDYETEDYDEREVENDYASEGKNFYRRKRASAPGEPPTSGQTPEGPDYIITLRPTQIRTFVVWFEPNTKP